MPARYAIIIVGIFSLAGCLSPVERDVDALVCNRAVQPMDLPPPGFLVPPKEPTPRPPVDPKLPQNFLQRMEIPDGVPGSDAPKIVPPKGFDKLPDKEKQAFIDKYFKAPFEVGSDPQSVPGPDGHSLSLADLQRMARENSPLLRQAASDIKAAEGAVIQAAVYNNPTLSYMSTPVSFTSGNTVGASISETIVTMGKRKVAEASAKMGLANAQLAYRRAETDLMASVRANYYAALVNEEGMRANRGLVELTDEIYKVMLQQLKGGVVAAYEPAQIGVFSGQAHIAYMVSRNSYLESWKMLATSIGLTMMPATQLSGSVSKELPRFDFEKSLAHVLENHTDALTALNGVTMARLNLRLAEVTATPDVTVGIGMTHDDSLPGPPRWLPTISASIPLPIFDRNQGNIRSAQGALVRAIEQPHATQNALTASFADAYRRLEENREVLEIYHRQLLPQQAQAFRATVIRHYGIGPVEVGAPGGATAYFGDLITAEQNLVSLIGTYLSTLAAYWQAVSDTASLLQTDDAYTMATAVEQFPEANLLELLNLPCCHPCSSLGQAGCSPKAQFVGQGHVELPLARGTAADQVADTDLQPAGDSHKPDCVVEVPTDVPPPHKLRGTLLAPEPDGEALEGGTR